MSQVRQLHRLFGLSWIDFFQGTSVRVELEVDLSLKQQFLDLVLIRCGPGALPRALPDGFEILGPRNLVTFKSYQEALDAWTLHELIGHYVNYRKQSSPSLQNLLPETDFQLFAVCVRYPHNLAQQVTLTRLRAGVYEVQSLTRRIRIIVVNELPQEEQNAMLHLFSPQIDLLRYGQAHYHPHSAETSTLLLKLLRAYAEDPAMSDKLKEFVRQTIDELLAELSTEERLKGISAEDRLKGMSTEEFVRSLSPETRKALRKQLETNGSPPQSN